MTTIHIAGQPSHGGLYQRCARCGYALQDRRSTAPGIPADAPDTGYPTWAVGAQVATDGTAHWAIGDAPLGPAMAECRGRLADGTPTLPAPHVIADVLFAVEDQGHTEEIALHVADDVIHALQVAGYAIVPTAPAPPELRERYAEALLARTIRGPKSHLFAATEHDLADAVLAVRDDELAELRRRVAEYENTITWETTCHGCARTLDGAIRETQRAEQAEAKVARARELSRLPEPPERYGGDAVACQSILGCSWDKAYWYSAMEHVKGVLGTERGEAPAS